MSQSLRFRAPVRPGDTVHAKVTVKEVIAEKGRVVLDTVCTVGDTVVIDGEATLMPTSRRNAKPPASSGVKVADAADLVIKLKTEAKVI
jgi:acyl-CoA thioesterase FadM